jgi:hypothetical protein
LDLAKIVHRATHQSFETASRNRLRVARISV